MTDVSIDSAAAVSGVVVVPGDKGISHRALLLGALARGRSYIGNLSPAADVASTSACLTACGAAVRDFGDRRVVADGAGAGRSLRAPAGALDCGNSGTTMRLLAGALAGHDLVAVLDGDASLRRRPMRRVADPLTAMGAEVTTSPAGTAPLQVRGRVPLRGIEYAPPVASAQLKSAVLLAGLVADGPTVVVERAATRDHTERMLRMCGVGVTTDGLRVTLTPAPLHGFGLRVPGDLSSAAFFLALAAAVPGGAVRCPGVTLNPGRTGILEVLSAMGAAVEVEEDADPAGGVEPVGTVTVGGRGLRGIRIAGDLIPRVIDELPVLAVIAAVADGVTEIADASELRVKESDRIALVAAGLRLLGVDVEERPDGLIVQGRPRLRPARLDAAGDHRLAMAWAVAGALAEPRGTPTVVMGAEACAVSYPGFFGDLATVTAGRQA